MTVPLLAGQWSRLGSNGWRYTNSSGPITSIMLRPDMLTVRGGNASWTYTLNELAQGRVAVRLALGTGVMWCADAPARAIGNPPSTAANDHVDKFRSGNTPAPGACPATP